MDEARSRYHHGDLRRALLEATLELVARKGARGFSLNEAARLAGVSSAAPYRHFADKQALLDELAAESFAVLRDALDGALGDVAPTAGRAEEVVALVRAYVRFALAAPARYEVMFSASRLRAGSGTSDQGRAAFAVLEAAMGRGITEGAFVAGRAPELAASVWALVHGVCGLALEGAFGPVAATGESAEEIALRSIRALLVGLAR